MSRRAASDGFALVIALGLMGFVLLLLLTITTLVQVEQVSSTTYVQQMEAEQAALLSLNMAIGKLQETAGLDQRVTAPAESLATVNGPKQLTGVWRSWEGSDHEADGLPRKPKYDKKLVLGDLDTAVAGENEGRFLGWLVSSEFDQAKITAPSASLPPTLEETGATVQLVAKGSVVPDAASGETAVDVEVHVVPTSIEDGSSAVAWWISGNNAKALIKEAPAELTDTDIAGWTQRMASNGRSDPEVFDLVDDANLGKISSLDSLNLASTSATDVSAEFFHDVTTFSRGLLTNTANGGWRRDLSLMAEEWSAGSLPASGLPVFASEPFSDPLEASQELTSSPANASIYPWVTTDNVTMSWHALMDFISLYRKVNVNPSGEPYFDAVVTNNSDWISIQTVLARIHFAFGYDATVSGANYTPRLLFKPGITYWNPYNVAVENPPSSLLHIYNSSFPIKLFATVGGQAEAEVNLQDMMETSGKSPMARISTDPAEGADRTWKPGESRMYGREGVDEGGIQVIYAKPGFRIEGSFVRNLSAGSSIVNGTVDDKFTYRWEHEDGDLSADIQYFWSRNQNPADGANLKLKSVRYRMNSSGATADEKVPLPDLVNDSQTLGTAADEDSPFFVISMGLRTLVNEDILEEQTKLHTKGYINTNPITAGVEMTDGVTAEDSPYTWEFFAPNAWEDAFMPQSDDAAAFGIDHSSYVGTSFQAGMGLNRWVIAELPTQPLLSLGELQHFDIRFRNAAPPRVANAIGNSHATPHVASNDIVNSDISEGSYDHSYASNHVLFDDWFFSSITPDFVPFTQNQDRSIQQVYADHLSQTTPLRNWQYLPATPVTVGALGVAQTTLSSATAWHDIASKLEVEGMFNINSTSVDAWKAVLMNLKDTKVPYSSVGSSSADQWETQLQTASGTAVSRTTVAGDPLSASDSDVALVATHVEMTEQQVEALAEAIVSQVKKRGPFLSLSEFVNRRLDTDKELAFAGAIDAALIELSELGNVAENPFAEMQQKYPQEAILPSDASSIYEFPEAAVGNYKGEPAAAAYGTPGWPRQADILRSLAPIISARDDTFTVRAYGDARDISGVVIARRWCEAVVQRKAGYVDAADALTEYKNLSVANQRLGRRFEIVSFRWLSENEI